MTQVIDGNTVGDRITDELAESIAELEANDVTPSLATVLMNDDGASETYVSMKQRACEHVGIDGSHIEIAPDAPAQELYDAIDDLNSDDDVNGILVQMPVPDHLDSRAIFERIDPLKDVDGFHPENVGRLVAGNPRFIPCTPHGIQMLLKATDINIKGKDIVIVGRSNIVGKPLANLLVQKANGGNATVTVCHSRTEDLGAKTRRADIIVAAVGVPNLINSDMISEGTTVIDVGVNRVNAENEKGYELVGDVDFKSAKDTTSAITPVPGGVGPMTITMLLYNTVKAASLQADVPVELPDRMSI